MYTDRAVTSTDNASMPLLAPAALEYEQHVLTRGLD